MLCIGKSCGTNNQELETPVCSGLVEDIDTSFDSNIINLETNVALSDVELDSLHSLNDELLSSSEESDYNSADELDSSSSKSVSDEQFRLMLELTKI